MSFSVVVTNWNRADVLPVCLRSILNQKGVNKMEIIIVDDASTDNSLEIIKKFKREYPDVIRAFETHKSLTENICLPANIGFKRAKYPYVVINPSDVIQVLDTNFSKYLNVLKKHVRAFADPILINFSGWARKKSHLAQAGGCTMTKWLRQIKGYDERMKGWGANEPDLFMRLGFIGVHVVKTDAVVLHMDRVVGKKRIHRTYNPRNAVFHRENREGVIAPNKIWGEHPLLEEVK